MAVTDPEFAITAFGFDGAFSTGTADFLRGIGVIKSFSARAPSLIVDPDFPTTERTVML